MFDKHIIKIILEAVQMLCTAVHILEPGKHLNLYKIAHKNHPVTVWMRTSLDNYLWTLDLVEAMHQEWKFRYNHPPTKEHKSYRLAIYLRDNAPEASLFPEQGLTKFAMAMPDEYKDEDPVCAYRKYYQSPEKRRLAAWKKREKPDWYKV